MPRPIDKRMAPGRNIGCKNPNPAVRDLAHRARILPAHTTGRATLFEKPRLVNHQNRVSTGQTLNYLLPHHIAQRCRPKLQGIFNRRTATYHVPNHHRL